MTVTKRIAVGFFAVAVAITGLELGHGLSLPGVQSAVSGAEARVGRPLTPVSVAGVGRRTVRRCAVGVYYC